MTKSDPKRTRDGKCPPSCQLGLKHGRGGGYFYLLQDSEGTNASIGANSPYESLNTHLYGAGRRRVWHYYGGTTPAFHKNVYKSEGHKSLFIFFFVFILCQINTFCHQLTHNMTTDFVRFTKICKNCSEI